MAPHRMSTAGSISALLALVASSGLVGVRPRAMEADGMSAVHHAAMSRPVVRLADHAAMHHMGGPREGHPASGTHTNCSCAGACLDGSPAMRADVPAVVESPSECGPASTPPPTLPIFGRPTAYLRPLPNGPPLA